MVASGGEPVGHPEPSPAVWALLRACARLILLLDAGGVHLRRGAAPAPEAYVRVVGGIAIRQSGSDGTAAATRRVVIVEHHPAPLWAPMSLAAPGLRACWSRFPILSRDGRVLGTSPSTRRGWSKPRWRT